MATSGASVSSGQTNTIVTQYEAALIDQEREATVVVPLTDFAQLGQARTRSIPQVTSSNDVSSIANGAAEVDAQTPSEITTSAVTVSANARALFILMSWVNKAQMAVDWDMAIPRILGRAAAEDKDTLAAALLSGFSNTSGTSGAPNSLQIMRDANLLLRETSLSIPGVAVVGVLAPKQINDLSDEAQGGVGSALSATMTRQEVIDLWGAGASMWGSYRGTYDGVPLFQTTLVPDANGSTDHGGAVFYDQEALMGGYNWDSQLNGPISAAVNFRLGDVHFVSHCLAFAEKNDNRGVSIITQHT